MGRVYDALKRAAENGAGNKGDVRKSHDDATRDAGDAPRRPSPNGNGRGDERAHGSPTARVVADARAAESPVVGRAAQPSLADRAAQEELLGRTSKFFHAPQDEGDVTLSSSVAAHGSASVEHTGSAPAGSALPGGQASRVAGATADAVGSARAAEFPSLE